MGLIDYAGLLLEVRELIDGTGRSVRFKKLNPTSISSTQPWKVDTTLPPITVDCFATFVSPGDAKHLGLAIQDAELFKRAQQVCLVAPHSTQDLSTFELLLDNDISWKVQWLYVLRPGDIALLFSIGVAQ